MGRVLTTPPPVRHSFAGVTLRRVDSSHLALGLMDAFCDEEFRCEANQLGNGDRVICCSDGLVETWDEAIRPDKSDLNAFIASCEPNEILSQISHNNSRYSHHDDTSLVVINMGGRCSC